MSFYKSGSLFSIKNIETQINYVITSGSPVAKHDGR